MKSIANTVLKEVEMVVSEIKEEEMQLFGDALKEAKRIFIFGEGRSGLMAKAFAMRMMHGGFSVYVIGETITPNIEESDLLVAVSGSGETEGIYQFASKAKKLGAQVALVTTNNTSKIAELADKILVIPAATKYRREGEPKTIQPLGNQFDQTVHLVLDAIIIGVLNMDKENSVNDEMRKRHTNLE